MIEVKKKLLISFLLMIEVKKIIIFVLEMNIDLCIYVNAGGRAGGIGEDGGADVAEIGGAIGEDK